MIFEREQTDNLGHLAVIIFGRDTKDNLAKEWGPKNFRETQVGQAWLSPAEMLRQRKVWTLDVALPDVTTSVFRDVHACMQSAPAHSTVH
jgi:hypothetical protein